MDFRGFLIVLFNQNQIHLHFNVWIHSFFIYLFIFRAFHGQKERGGHPSAAFSPGCRCTGRARRAERARGAFPGVPAGCVTSAVGYTGQSLQNPGEVPSLYTWKGWEGRSLNWSSWTLVSGGGLADEDFRKLPSKQKMMRATAQAVPGSAGSVRLGSTQFDRVYSPLVMIVTFRHA